MVDLCTNTDQGVTDKVNDTCDLYRDIDCGHSDDSDFDSYKMCCACGGGLGGIIIISTNTTISTNSDWDI